VKAFSLSGDQALGICASLIADEASERFGRHIDIATSLGWTPDTALGDGGVELSDDERAAVAARVARFFGGRAEEFAASETLGAIGDAATRSAALRLERLSFAAAGGSGETEHPADRVFMDAAAAANLLYGRRRLLSLVAPHGLIGFMLSTLAPNLLRIPALDARRMSPEELTSALAFGDVVVATPSLWRYLIAQGVAAPDNTMAVFFGEPMSLEQSAGIRKAGFGAQREIYGSTETGLVGWRDTPSDPFALFDHWRRDGEGLVRTTPSGDEVALAPMDVIVWEGERRFRLGGRRDGAVQIGGVNVFPDRIATIIASHAAVSACTVHVAGQAEGGDRLVAMIALAAGAPTESVARSIDLWCRARLRPHERPRVYNFVAP
jgi:4-coumarate--CoA ligase (photoactive yellow protein activation family)